MNTTRIILNEKFIDKEMKKRGINSFNELARQVGISGSTLSLISRGKRNPGSKVINLMMAYFQADFEKIFKRELTKVHKNSA